LTWFLPGSGIDSKQEKRDWGSIKLTQKRNRADLGVREGMRESKEKLRKTLKKKYRFGGENRETRPQWSSDRDKSSACF
jgi:hypothetical protein